MDLIAQAIERLEAIGKERWVARPTETGRWRVEADLGNRNPDGTYNGDMPRQITGWGNVMQTEYDARLIANAPALLAVVRYLWEVMDEWVPADITYGVEQEILAILRGEVSKPKDDDPLTIKASVHNVISEAVTLSPAQEKLCDGYNQVWNVNPEQLRQFLREALAAPKKGKNNETDR